MLGLPNQLVWRGFAGGSTWKGGRANGSGLRQGDVKIQRGDFSLSISPLTSHLRKTQTSPASPAASPIPKCRLMSLKPLKSLRWVHGQSPSDSHKYLQWLKPPRRSRGAFVSDTNLSLLTFPLSILWAMEALKRWKENQDTEGMGLSCWGVILNLSSSDLLSYYPWWLLCPSDNCVLFHPFHHTHSKALVHSFPHVLGGMDRENGAMSSLLKVNILLFLAKWRTGIWEKDWYKKCVWGGRAEPECTHKVAGKVYSAHSTPTLVIRDPEDSDRGREWKHQGSKQSVGVWEL